MYRILRQRFASNMNFETIFSNETTFNINEKGRNGKSLLHDACERNDIESVKLLVTDEAVDLGVTDDNGYTPLHCVCKKAFLECLEYMIDHSKSVNIEDLLQRRRRTGILQLTVIPSPLSVKDESGKVILHHACDKGRAHLVDRLLAFHADPNVQDNAHCTPLHYACWRGNMDIIKALIHTYKANLNIPCNSSGTVVHYACKERKLKLLQVLLSCNPDLSVVDCSIRTPLHLACESDFVEGVSELLARGSCCTAEDASGFTPMYYACQHSHLQCVEYLIEKSEQGVSLLTPAVLDARNTYSGKGILHCACEVGNVKVVKWLIEAGADLSVKDNKNTTPLHLACVNHHWNCVDSLLDRCIMKGTEGKQILLPVLMYLNNFCRRDKSIHGFITHLFGVDNTTLMNERGHKLLIYAIEGNLWSCVENVVQCFISSVPKDQCKSFLSLIVPYTWKCTSYSILDELIDLDVNLAVTDTNGYTLLHNLCMNANRTHCLHTVDSLDHLLKHLPDAKIQELIATSKCPNPLTITDPLGQVILHHVCKKDHAGLVKRILHFGAEPDVKDALQRTPLHYACMGGNSETVSVLISKDTNLAALADVSGCTPMHYACSYAHVSCVQILIDKIPQYQHLLEMSTGMIWGATPLTIQQNQTQKVILHHACEKGANELIKVLIKAGASPFVYDATKTTPLHYAFKYCHWDCVNILLDHCIEAKVTLPEFSKSFLILALENCELFVACKLLRADCKLESIESHAVHQTACKNYDWGKVHRLTDHCMETLSRNNAQTFLNPFLPRACERGDLFIVTRLLGIVNCAIVHHEVQAALKSACENGHLECVEFIADHCIRTADTSTVKQLLKSALSLAFDRSPLDSERLIGIGYADILASRGITLILSACENDHWKCVEHLVNRCIEIMPINEIQDLHSILPYVYKNGSLKVDLFIKLVEVGAPLTGRDTNGYTCLHYLCKNGHLSGLEYLILDKYHKDLKLILDLFQHHSWYYFGATPLTIQDESGKVILHHACQGGTAQLVQKLFDFGAKANVYDNRLFTPLHYACQRGKFDVIRIVIESGADLNAVCDGGAALHYACKQRNTKLVQLLLSSGANPNVCDQNALTPLHTACQHGAAEVIDALVAGGANCAAKDKIGFTPMHYACKNAHLQCVRHLIGKREQHKYLLHKRSKLFYWGYSPTTITEDLSGKVVLHHACEQGDFELVRILIEAGVSIYVYDSNRRTPLHYAFMSNSSESCVKYLVDHCEEAKDKSDSQKFLNAFLPLACKKGYLKVVKSLVNFGCELSVDDSNNSPLLCAAENDHWDCVQWLVDHCVSCTMKEVKREQLLDPILPLACQKNDLAVIKKLMGANEGEVMKERARKLLHYACVNGHWSCVEMLLENCNRRSSSTPVLLITSLNDVLHYACRSGNIGVIEKLVKMNAKFSIADDNNFTPLHYLCQNAHVLCLEYVLGLEDSRINEEIAQIMKSDFTPLGVKDNLGKAAVHHACEKGSVHLVRLLLACGADPGVLDGTHCTPLHYACWKEDMDIIEELLAKKPDLVNVACDGSGTPLQDACAKGNVRLVEVLISAHADLNVSDSDGCTPLHIACRGGFLDVVQRLASAKGNCIAKDKHGQTPMHHASKNGHLPCVEALINRSPNGQSLLKVPATPVSDDTPLTVHNTSGKVLLHYACEQGNIRIARMAIEEGADPTVDDSSHLTPLHYACEKNHTLCAEHMIDHCRNSKVLLSGMLPLVSKKRNLLLVKKLLSTGANYSVKDAEGKSALHYACENNDVHCAECLIQHCEKVLNPPKLKKYLSKHLRIASVGDHVDVVEKLLQAGADIAVQDGNGDTAVYFAYRNNYRQSASKMIDSCLKLLTKDQNKQILNPILLLACKEGDSSTVKKICKVKIDLEFTDYLKNTPLHYACQNSNIQCVQAILNTQKSHEKQLTILRIPNKDGKTPLNLDTGGRVILHEACEKGNVGVVKLLLAAGASRQARIKASGLTPIHLACLNGHIDCLEAILNEQSRTETCVLLQLNNGSGITPLSIRDRYGRTILHHACNKDRVDLVKDLISAGADPCVQDYRKYTPLVYACEQHSFLCVEYLVNNTSQPFEQLINFNTGVNPRVLTYLKDSRAGTVLHYACKAGKVAVVKQLIGMGADATAKNKDGSTPLHMACQHGRLKCVQYLLSLPQSPITYSPKYFARISIARDVLISAFSMTDDSGKVVLHHACKEGNVEMVKRLLIPGAPTATAVDSEGYTPLHFACQGGHVSILQIFPDLVTLLTVKGSNGYIPLHCACESGQLECVEYLIDNHWDLMKLAQAEESPSPLIIKRSHGPTIFQLACQRNNAKLVKKLSKFIIDPNVEDSEGYSFPMHLAMNPIDKTVLYSILESFKEAEWTIDTEHRKTKKTALHLACESGNIDCVEFLLINGADLSLKDCDERTPLLAACANFKCFTASQPESVLLKLIRLLTTGEGDCCNINAQDKKEGKTALHYSAECHDPAIPFALLDAGGDITSLDLKGSTFVDLAPTNLFIKLKEILLKMKRHKIVCVVGYPKCGKSTLIAAIEEAQKIQGTLNEWSCEFFRREVDLDDKRTAGIVTKEVNCKSLGSIRFFDFAGHSEYYTSHLAFLDSALSVKDVSVTFIMMTDLRKPEKDRLAECKEWLSQIKSVIKNNNNSQLKVILVGSHLDQFYAWNHSNQNCLLEEMFDKLKRTFKCDEMHFEGCVAMNCRRLISTGSRILQGYLASGYQSGTSSDIVSPGACVLFNNLKEMKQVLSLEEVKKLHDRNSSLPSTLEYVGKLCEQLAASGLILYIADKSDSRKRWVIVQVEDVLSEVHGTLFAPPDKQEFPYQSCLDNKFGLITLNDLELGFKDSNLPLQMIKELLTTMQFCYRIPARILYNDILNLLYKESSIQECSEWLYFPHLVKAHEFDNVSDLFPSKRPRDHWICWELQVLDSNNHRFNPVFQQALLITFGAKFIEPVYNDAFEITDHSCVVLRNGIFWSTMHGVDVCVIVKEKCVVQVLGRSKEGFKPLISIISKVVQEVYRVKNHREFCHSFPLITTSYFRKVVKGLPLESCSLSTKSVFRCLQSSKQHVSCTCHKHSCSLLQFFGSESKKISLQTLKELALKPLKKMIPQSGRYTFKSESSDEETAETEYAPAHNMQCKFDNFLL